MGLDNDFPSSTSEDKCVDSGGSPLIDRSLSGTCFRSVKRKHDDESKFVIPGLDLPRTARVEIGDEVDVLRETVGSQQLTIQDLNSELEEERDASSSAANEAMSMILRLQREKAETQMEARQFKRFAEEKTAHLQHEIMVLKEMLFKREQAIQSLTCEVQAYKHRIMSYGLTESEADEGISGSRMMSRNNSANDDGQFDFPSYDYPPLKCHAFANNTYEADNEVEYDVEKYACGDTPQSREHLKDLELRINQLEKTPTSIQSDGEFLSSRNMALGQSPRRAHHLRKFSSDSAATFLKETVFSDSPKFNNVTEECSTSRNVNNDASEAEVEDEVCDRVYTIDSVNEEEPYESVVEPIEDHKTTNGGQFNHLEIGDPEVKKMYMRLQALEADRESMRQALIHMRTDKAQFVLLKEIAQHLCKDMPPAGRAPSRNSALGAAFSVIPIFKWVVSFVHWKRRARKCRYMFGSSPHHTGLRTVLDKGPRIGQWRCLSNIQL